MKPEHKTLKRETAALMLLFLAGIAVYDIVMGGNTPAQKWGEMLMYPIFLSAGGAFGLDSAIKQGGWLLGGKRSDQ